MLKGPKFVMGLSFLRWALALVVSCARLLPLSQSLSSSSSSSFPLISNLSSWCSLLISALQSYRFCIILPFEALIMWLGLSTILSATAAVDVSDLPAIAASYWSYFCCCRGKRWSAGRREVGGGANENIVVVGWWGQERQRIGIGWVQAASERAINSLYRYCRRVWNISYTVKAFQRIKMVKMANFGLIL